MSNQNLDSADLRLLALLQEDASRSNQELATAAHMAAATCHRRVQRLRQLGLIARTVALLDPARVKELLNIGLQAIIEVSLDEQSSEKLHAFEARALQRPEVTQCWCVSGGPDFVLMVSVLDMEHYNRLTQELLSDDVNVRNVRAFFCTKRSKFSTSLPLHTRA